MAKCSRGRKEGREGVATMGQGGKGGQGGRRVQVTYFCREI